MSADYKCIDCGQDGLTLGETFDHAELHRPYEAKCPDGYTRRFKTQAEAEAAKKGEKV